MTKRRDALKDYLTPITAKFSTENPAPRQRPHMTSGALQSMNEAISGLGQEADVLRKALADGLTIVELDPADIDASFVKDRLDDFASDDFEALVESIRENGQILPVLVRPHPERRERYQLAFGHRRVAALRRLGQPVKAFVKELTDDELVIAQGNENLERKDLSFIERALFALRLEDRGTSRMVIMQTLGTRSKGVLSEMIALARKLPIELIETIGAAPGIGRPRWDKLVERLANTSPENWRELVATAEFNKLASAARFEAVFDAIAKPASTKASGSESIRPWMSDDKSVAVTLKSTAKKTVVTYESKDGPSFAGYITARLEGLYQDFRRSQKASTGD